MAFALFAALLYGVVTPLASGLWPRRVMSTLVYAALAIGVYPLLWGVPGPAAVLLGMLTLLLLLRALDARATFEDESKARHALYCHWLETHRSERREAFPPAQRLLRLVRGLALLAIGLGLIYAGSLLEPWRIAIYLDDVLVAAEVGCLFVGAVDLVTAVCMTLGVQFFLVDGCSAGVAWAPSLSAFWSKWWNRPTAGVLQRGIFTPAGGIRVRARGVLLVFVACGIMHALPLILGGQDRWRWALIAAGALLFFLVQAVGVMIDGTVIRRLRSPALSRAFFYLVMGLSVAFYPSPFSIAADMHHRPLDTATTLVLLRFIGFEV